MNTPIPTTRYTLRDLPLPAKLVVTTFLISVGLGYLWAMAQIHFKHASPGSPMPTTEDLVARFSGVPWPLEPKPEPKEEKVEPDNDKQVVLKKPGVKIKSIIDNRCARCHKKGGDKGDAPMTNWDEVAKLMKSVPVAAKGKIHRALTGSREEWDGKNMVSAFFEESTGWDKLTDEQRKTEEPKREAERRVLVLWIDSGGKKEEYEANQFVLPPDYDRAHLPSSLLVETDPDVIGAARAPARPKPANEKAPIDRWKDAKEKQIGYESLTQSTHAHLLSFSMLWALTGITFAFTSYSYCLRCLVSPLVLIAQVADIACWWLARLDGPGPYFAIAIVATGGVVALGLGAQITLSLFNMYGKKGRMVIAAIFLAGAGLFGLTYAKVIAPQLESEKAFVAQQAK
jgi:hypothetical protein